MTMTWSKTGIVVPLLLSWVPHGSRLGPTCHLTWHFYVSINLSLIITEFLLYISSALHLFLQASLIPKTTLIILHWQALI